MADPWMTEEAFEALDVARQERDAARAEVERWKMLALDAEGREASVADLLNSWAREASVQEATRQEDANAVADRLWAVTSGEAWRTREEVARLRQEMADEPHVLAETEAALRACAEALRGIAKWAEPPAYLPDAGVWALYRVDKEAASDALALPAVRRVMESKG